jgi:hypothetical protein
MERLKTWGLRIGFVAVAAGALLSRDACLGGSHPPTAAPAQTAAPTQTSFATPP